MIAQYSKLPIKFFEVLDMMSDVTKKNVKLSVR